MKRSLLINDQSLATEYRNIQDKKALFCPWLYAFHITCTHFNENVLTVPLVGPSSAMTIFKVVLFPAQLGPSRPNTSPGCTKKELFCTATLMLSSFFLQAPSSPLTNSLRRSRANTTAVWKICHVLKLIYAK